MWMLSPPMQFTASHPIWLAPWRPVVDRISRLVHDRLGHINRSSDVQHAKE